MLSEARHSQSINRLAAALALVLGLAVAGGCASGGDEGATASASAAGSGSGSESGEAYPNLGDVPDRPATMTEEQRRQLEQGLVADSQQRAYSEDVITFQADPAEPLPAPMETGAGGAAGQSLGDVTMPGAVAPPFSGAPSTPSAAPEAPAAPAATTGVSAATSGASAAAAERAAAAAQATAPNIPVPPEDPMARATTPPFSGATAPPVSQAPAPPVPQASAPPVPQASAPPVPQASAPYTPPPAAAAPPPVAAAPPAVSYAPAPGAPKALAGDASTSNLNRAQLDSLQPSTPPFSGATGAAPGSYAPTPLTAGAAAGASAPTPVASAYVPPPATPAYTPTPATPAYTPTPVTPAYTPPPAASAQAPPPAASAYPPPPVAPASAPPEGVQQVYEARLQDTLPPEPMASLPSAGDLEGDEPLATVVVSSTGVATFEELPVNVPVLEREPVPAAVAGGQRASHARSAVPGSSVKVATILFSDGSSDLRDREREIVREVYERYLSSGRKVRVVGHSSSRTRNMDPVRHRMVNFGISAERANAVAMELQRLGVPSDQITVVAAADDMPMYYEVMPSGEAGNRRTEIYLD